MQKTENQEPKQSWKNKADGLTCLDSETHYRRRRVCSWTWAKRTENLWKGLTIPGPLRTLMGRSKISTLTGVQEVSPTLTDDFGGVKTSVEEVAADVEKQQEN